MNDFDKDKFKEILICAGEIYSKTITKPMMRMYFDALSEFTIEQVGESFGKHVKDTRHGSFFPKPADIRRGIIGEALSPSEEFRQYLRSQGREVRF